MHCSAKKFERMTHTLGTRGFSRVRREFSVLAESRHIFGRRRVTIKTWQKPETALEKSLAPRVNDTRTYLHMFASAKESNRRRFDSYSSATVIKQCIDHIPYYLSGFSAHIFSKIEFCHAAAILSQDIKKLCFCTASLAVRTRLAVQKQSFFNLLGRNGRRMTKVYSCICTDCKLHTFDFSASISSL